ncbi:MULTISPECIES: DUF167 family protein [unclassified Methylobacterium]|jgi:uncharacterized protein YggU (UPF0235/DUF167 family)|uniref:DUF167 family protein n=1 Tax=unclassified Methylobacterium TaxID=2615210 RepID=UPI0013533CF9|nr:DUF167 family protein [Methylobacterium sp. 2A]MWV21742.1 DUF167 domain-containing protein [Methylobacterium sp. 2A]
MTVRLAVRLTPRGGRDAVDGWARDEKGQPYLKARVAAPPVEGAANAALEKMIAKMLKVSRGAVRIASGDQSRLKILEIDGIGQADVERVFGQPG